MYLLEALIGGSCSHTNEMKETIQQQKKQTVINQLQRAVKGQDTTQTLVQFNNLLKLKIKEGKEILMFNGVHLELSFNSYELIDIKEI